MTPAIRSWAHRHGISHAILADLARSLEPDTSAGPAGGSDSEAYAQSAIRLEAARTPGVTLFRNNVGVLTDERGRPVRFGLANDTHALNDRLKSADLIGWRTVTITPDMVGTQIAQFVARECKARGWQYGGDKRETAQANFLALVTAAGGDACFATGEGTL